jgi:hypothetical protein
MKKFLTAAAIAAGIAVSLSTATSAQAAPDCEAASFAFSQCAGSYQLSGGQNDVTNGAADNLASQLLNEQNVFDQGDWTFGAKYDGGLSGNNKEGFSVSGLNKTSGSFSFANIDLTTTDVAISLKSAKGFSLYYFAAGSIGDASQINWDTAGTSTNNKGKAQALSHISYYTRIAAVTPEIEQQIKKVPEPTAMAGLLAVGMMATARRRHQR